MELNLPNPIFINKDTKIYEEKIKQIVEKELADKGKGFIRIKWEFTYQEKEMIIGTLQLAFDGILIIGLVNRVEAARSS